MPNFPLRMVVCAETTLIATLYTLFCLVLLSHATLSVDRCDPLRLTDIETALTRPHKWARDQFRITDRGPWEGPRAEFQSREWAAWSLPRLNGCHDNANQP